MRIRSIASVSVAAVAMGMALATTPAQAAPAVSYGPYQFKNDYSHLCMDVANGSKVDGARIQQWDCYGGPAEKWRLDVISTINGVNYYAFVNMNSGKCLDVPGGSTTPGVELQQWTCWSGDMQQWALYRAGTSSLTIRNLKNGLCVDVKNWGGAGAALQQWDCNDLAVQTWQYS
ncbi:RICIN domain-containing protein [Streptomyces sp. NPDC056672]|uniref:RICIN domain-containing protein n=1 Tax=Streptomyces sp. NPDC056672 TaxID=3345906 RepID=UPI00369E8046